LSPREKDRHSLRLDGSNGYAEVASALDLNLTADWTVEAWFKDEDPSGFIHDYRQILIKGDRNSNPEAPYFVLVGQNQIIAGVRTGGVDYSLSYDLTSLGLHPGEWLHVAVSFDASKNWLDLWLNGQHIYSTTVPSHSQIGNALPVEIGRNGPATGKYWLGKIEDVRIWNIARSGDDIASDFNSELVGNEPNLVANWTFDEASGTSAADIAGNHTATLKGGAGFATDVHP
jgi:hypothetical protein